MALFPSFLSLPKSGGNSFPFRRPVELCLPSPSSSFSSPSSSSTSTKPSLTSTPSSSPSLAWPPSFVKVGCTDSSAIAVAQLMRAQLVPASCHPAPCHCRRQKLQPEAPSRSYRCLLPHAALSYSLGIYMEDGKVIHFTNADTNSFSSCPSKLRNLCETCGDQSRSHGVIISCLDCFLSGGDLYLFRYSVSPFFFIAQVRGGTCTRAPSDPCDVVLHRARYLLDHNGFGIYNAFRNNCEDFAIYCKTGLLVKASYSTGNSGQASALMTAAGAAIAPAAIAFSNLRSLATANPVSIVVAGGMYCVGRYVSDIGFRPDTIKISVEDLVAKMH